MERRIFGCSQFSDLVFKNSLAILEKTLDFILNDLDNKSSEGNKKVFKLGFYASQQSNSLTIMVEIFDNDEVY